MSLAKEYLTAPKEAEPCIGRARGGIFGAAPSIPAIAASPYGHRWAIEALRRDHARMPVNVASADIGG